MLFRSYRWGGQTLKDANRARTPEQLEAMRQKCPIATLRGDMESRDLIDAARFEGVVHQARERIAAAERKARGYEKLPANAARPLDGLLNVYAS